MKLWKKIVMVVLAVETVSFFIFSQTFFTYMEKKQLSTILDTRKEQMTNIVMLMEKMTGDEDYGEMTEVTRRALTGFYLKKYAPRDYAIVNEKGTLASTCSYEISLYDPWYQKPQGNTFFTMQTLQEKKFLILSENIILWHKKYAIYGIDDITDVYEEFYEVRIRLLAAGAGILLFTCLLLFFTVKKMLDPLKKMTVAAQKIQNGDYQARTGSLTKKKDEIGVVAFAFDQMACEIEHKIGELEEASQRQRQLLGALSHEIKTPVTSLIGYSDTLLHVKLPEKQKEKALRRLYEESSRLERLSAKLMSLIGLYENDSIGKKPAAIGRIMEDVRQMTRHSLEEKQIRIEFEWIDFLFEADADLMESMLMNFIDNSRKASDYGGRIKVRAVPGKITVEDEGCGIAEEELEKIRDPFYMVDKARKKQEGNLGLGLSLCVQIAELHGGTIEIDSRPQEGTLVAYCWNPEENTEEQP